jgi:CobQ-like glutamine amidotransferase family enzyme
MVSKRMHDYTLQVPAKNRQLIVIGHLFSKQMNVYGDMGNIITLRYRLEARGFRVEYTPIDDATDLKIVKPDIIVGGGGQDSNQDLVQGNLLKNKTLINNLAENGTVMLMICGLYQLFGHRFVVGQDHVIEGIGVFDLETIAGDSRLIGNIVVDSQWGRLVGFENHSGRTMLGTGVKPLGTVIKGVGNNDIAGDEGAVYNNVFGSYLHGPMLAKNPVFTDELIKRMLHNKGISEELDQLDDEVERMAATLAAKRPR